MRDQFRIERYEMQLMRIRFLSVGMTLYAIAMIFLHDFMHEKLLYMFGGLFAVLIVFWLISGAVGATMGKKSKHGKEIVFLPIGIIMCLGIFVAEKRDWTELLWIEAFTLILFLAINVYALYLANYVKFVYANRDADYMAVYHVTLGNTRAYRLWYMITVLAVLCVAILPFWGPMNGLFSKLLDRMNSASGPATPVPIEVTIPPQGEITPAVSVHDSGFAPGTSGNNEVIAAILSAVLIVAIIAAAIFLGKIMISRITDAKTSMETDRIIDLKRTLIPIPTETIRVRDDSVADENAYARRIRRTFKRTVFDRYGDEDIPELTPTDLLGNVGENREVLLEKYEKARYSGIPCTADDVKAVRGPKQ
ncbi:MAG: hypothetical protein IKX54_00965 [Lachnospiraceae bacterium]|nr:hypothetical protein [Lachnospiraceae bacterium]